MNKKPLTTRGQVRIPKKALPQRASNLTIMEKNLEIIKKKLGW